MMRIFCSFSCFGVMLLVVVVAGSNCCYRGLDFCANVAFVRDGRFRFSSRQPSPALRNVVALLQPVETSRLFSSSRTNHDNDLGVQVAQHVQPHVVLVSPKGVRNMTARGSCFVMVDLLLNEQAPPGKVWILTAAHVTSPGYSIQVTWPTIKFNDDNDHPVPTETSSSLPKTMEVS